MISINLFIVKHLINFRRPTNTIAIPPTDVAPGPLFIYLSVHWINFAAVFSRLHGDTNFLWCRLYTLNLLDLANRLHGVYLQIYDTRSWYYWFLICVLILDKPVVCTCGVQSVEGALGKTGWEFLNGGWLVNWNIKIFIKNTQISE